MCFIALSLGLVICITTIIFLYYNHFRNKFAINVDKTQGIEVVKFVEALREVCPVGVSSGWTLVSTHHGLRCWQRKLPISLCGEDVILAGAATMFDFSATSVLNVVADVTTWPEWDPQIYQVPLKAELSEDLQLHADFYMQSDQLVSLDSSHCQDCSKAGIYRFGNLESNGLVWILLWHVSKIDWWFYLAQPLENSSSSCVVTLIHGCPSNSTKGEPISLFEDHPLLASKLSNLRDALAASQHHIKPFCSLMLDPGKSTPLHNPHLPAVKTALSDLTSKPCVLLKTDKRPFSRTALLTLVPFSSTSKSVSLKTLSGFILMAISKDRPIRPKRRHPQNKAANSSDKGASQKGLKPSSSTEPTLRHSTNRESKCSDSEDQQSTDQSESDARQHNSCFLPDVLPQDYDLVGQHCVSQVLTEVYHSSMIEPNSSAQLDQASLSGWMFEGNNKDITLLSKFSMPNNFSYLSKGEMSVAAEEAWEAVKNPYIRLVYDPSAKKITVLEELSKTQKIVRVRQESGGVMKREAQDFHLLQTEVADNGSKYVLAFRSIQTHHPLKKTGPLKFLPSGWVIEPLAAKSCMVTYLIQVSICGGDRSLLEDIGTLQSHAISSLRKFFAYKPNNNNKPL